MVHRKLNRTAQHRACLLRNLVTNLLEHESIVTTHAKAKEAQTAAERLITAARNIPPNQSRHKTTQTLGNKLYKPDLLIPKLMNDLSKRYANFTGGYTRVLKLEPRLGDNAPQSILELVDGRRDMRRALTARVVARYEAQGADLDDITRKNVRKICRDEAATARFREEVEEMRKEFYTEDKLADIPTPPKRTKKLRAPIELAENPLLS